MVTIEQKIIALEAFAIIGSIASAIHYKHAYDRATKEGLEWMMNAVSEIEKLKQGEN